MSLFDTGNAIEDDFVLICTSLHIIDQTEQGETLVMMCNSDVRGYEYKEVLSRWI